MNENWSCVVITCPSLSSVLATEREVEILKEKGRIPHSVCVLTIEDPAKNLGSGAATLNALLVAVEYLSAKQNYMVLTSDVLLESRILILHNGRDYLYSCSGKAFISLPLEYAPEDKSKPYCSGILSNLEAAFQLIAKLSMESPYGVWVCSTDMLILPKKKCSNTPVTWENVADVVMFCIPVDIEYATGHGVISTDDQGYVSDIFYCQPFDHIKNFAQGDGKVPIVSGIVFFKTNVAESLLSLHVHSPLDSCTYLGLDCGNQPIQVSLFFDLLIAMATNLTRDTFISGKCGKTYNNKFGIQANCSNENMLARSLVWKELNSYKMSAKIIADSQHLYWSNEQNASYHVNNLLKIAPDREVHSVYQAHSSPSSNSWLLVNSHLEANVLQLSSKTVVIDSLLRTKNLKIGENCFISGISFCDEQYTLNIPDNLCIINTSVQKFAGNECFILFGTQENPFLPVNFDQGTFCNKSWSKILKKLCVEENEIWTSDLCPEEKTLTNARLFCCDFSLKDILDLFVTENEAISSELIKRWKSSTRYSLRDILENINYSANFIHKRHMYAEIACRKIRNSICENQDLCLLPYFYAACAENWSVSVMNTLDDVLLADVNSVIKTRTLSCIADLLSIKAGVAGGLRTGPGSNRTWNKAFTLLLNGNVDEGLKELLKERSHWLNRPNDLIRAARHYERAAQIFIQNSVKTVKEYMHLTQVQLLEIGVPVTAECPARIDIQGGWSDTPPICYELGGSVVNIALLIDGKKPIGSRAFRTREPYITLKIGLKEMTQVIVMKDMKDVLNYDQPNAQGALLKAALVCANIVDVNCEKSLEEQLLEKFGGGFEIQSWSLLPQGCGMGTSSILAGAIVAVLWSVTGKSFDKSSVIHAVLYVEQLLTTGGGWQDQVAGITGGVNRGYSDPTFPLHIKVEPLKLQNSVMQKLNSHLLLIYTGKVRLAKNLLQNVIRNWYAREETIVRCFKDLITNSFKMKEALLNGDFPEIGRLLDVYWEQKKLLAPGCEPTSVREIMDILRPLCYGQLLAGAGGGGFMCVLTREPNAKEVVTAALQKYKELQKLSIHDVTIHEEGLEITL